jgi:hypothetical protein
VAAITSAISRHENQGKFKMYYKDANRVRDCACPSHKGPCKCSSKKRPFAPSPKPKTLDPGNATAGTVMAGVAAESQAINTSRAAEGDLYGMASRADESGLQLPYHTNGQLLASSEEDEACESEKTVADRLRQAHASKDPHAKNFLKMFYRGRAAERASRAK